MFFISRSDPESSDDQKKVAKLSIRKKGIGSEARAERVANADTDLQLLNNAERERLLQKQKKRRLKGREDEVCCHVSLILQLLVVLYFFSRYCTFILSAY